MKPLHHDNRRLQQENKKSIESCDITDIWQILGKRWSLQILKNLSIKEVRRFNELKRTLNGISSTVLSDRLAELEREGFIIKKIYPEVPLRVEYCLTSQTRELETILKDLSIWMDKWKRSKNKK